MEVTPFGLYPTAFQECYLFLRLESSSTFFPKTKPPLFFLGAAVSEIFFVINSSVIRRSSHFYRIDYSLYATSMIRQNGGSRLLARVP